MLKLGTISLYQKGENGMARKRGQKVGHLYSENGVWYLRYRVDTSDVDKNGKPVRERVTRQIGPSAGPGAIGKRQATRIAYEDYLSKVDQTSLRPGSKSTVDQFYLEKFEPNWIATLRPSAQSQYRSIYKNHIKPVLGNCQLREVTTAHCLRMIAAATAKKMSPTTVGHIRKIAGAILKHAKDMGCFTGDLPTSNTRALRMPKKKLREEVPPTWEQIQAIAIAIEQPEVSSLVLLLAITGMRIGEAMGLRWKCVDLENGKLAIEENYNMGRYSPDMKTTASRRVIPLPAWAVDIFAGMKARPLFAGPTDPVWAGSTGRPLDQHNVAKRVLKPAGAKVGLPGIHWHSFRHANASMTDQIMTTAQRQQILGHASPAMTHHYTTASLEATRKALGNIKLQ